MNPTTIPLPDHAHNTGEHLPDSMRLPEPGSALVTRASGDLPEHS
jgi:hypothetical protein